MSEAAHRNITRTIDKLGVDHMWLSPGKDFYERLYGFLFTQPTPKEYVKTICPQCFAATSLQAIKLAAEKDIPLLAYGFAPGQGRSSIIRVHKFLTITTLLLIKLHSRRSFKIKLSEEEKRHFDLPLWDMRKVPRIIFPFRALDYNIREIKDTVIDLGLIAPGDEHPLSSNCLINLLMIELDSLRFRYHPYTAEFSSLVREWQLDRDEWLALEEKGIEEIENRVFERDKIDSVVERLELASFYEEYLGEWTQKILYD